MPPATLRQIFAPLKLHAKSMEALEDFGSGRVVPLHGRDADTSTPVRTAVHGATLPRHRGIMRLLLRGATVSEIADLLGVHPNTVSRLINTDIFKSEMDKLQARADQKVIEDTTDVGAWLKKMCGSKVKQTLETLLDDTKTHARLKADICFDILDRGGHKAVERREVTVDYAQMVQSAYERRKAMAALPAPDAPVRFADVPQYDPPTTPAEPKQFALTGFEDDASGSQVPEVLPPESAGGER